jgi:hypothetical protein
MTGDHPRNFSEAAAFLALKSVFGHHFEVEASELTGRTHAMQCAHLPGMIIQAFCEDHVLWGTDSIRWGFRGEKLLTFRALITDSCENCRHRCCDFRAWLFPLTFASAATKSAP